MYLDDGSDAALGMHQEEISSAPLSMKMEDQMTVVDGKEEEKEEETRR